MNYDQWKTTPPRESKDLPMRTVRIEIEIPAEMDTSDVLAQMQEIAVQWADEHAINVDDWDSSDPDERERETYSRDDVENAVSVEDL